MSDDVHIIANLPKGRDRVRVALDSFKGTRLIDLRVTVPISNTCDAFTPSKAGVALAIEKLPLLRAAIVEAEAEAIELGWLKGGEHE